MKKFHKKIIRQIDNIPAVVDKLYGQENVLQKLRDNIRKLLSLRLVFTNDFKKTECTENIDYKDFAEIVLDINKETDPMKIIEKILDGARQLCNADGGTIYELVGDKLNAVALQNDTLEIRQGGYDGDKIALNPVPLEPKYVAAYVAINGKAENISDVHQDASFDFTGTKEYDSNMHYRSKSMLVIPLIDQQEKIIGIIQLLNAKKDNVVVNFSDQDQELVSALATQAASHLSNMRLLKEKGKMEMVLVKLLSKIEEYKDRGDIEGHIRRVGKILRRFLEHPALRKLIQDHSEETITWEKYIEDISVGGMLHDFAKAFMTDLILKKPARLNQEEFDVMKVHAPLGGAIIFDVFKDAGIENTSRAIRIKEMIDGHHENWDGTGYHNQLKEYEIPISAQIMAFADVFDALASKRIYKEKYGYDEIKDQMIKDKGKKYNPEMFDIFMELFDEMTKIVEQDQTMETASISDNKINEYLDKIDKFTADKLKSINTES